MEGGFRESHWASWWWWPHSLPSVLCRHRVGHSSEHQSLSNALSALHMQNMKSPESCQSPTMPLCRTSESTKATSGLSRRRPDSVPSPGLLPQSSFLRAKLFLSACTPSAAGSETPTPPTPCCSPQALCFAIALMFGSLCRGLWQ